MVEFSGCPDIAMFASWNRSVLHDKQFWEFPENKKKRSVEKHIALKHTCVSQPWTNETFSPSSQRFWLTSLDYCDKCVNVKICFFIIIIVYKNLLEYIACYYTLTFERTTGCGVGVSRGPT